MWSNPPNHLQLLPQQIHLWWADLLVNNHQYESYWQTLSEAEKRRSQRFQKTTDGRQFVVTRGILRHLLGQYLNQEARAIQFEYIENNKPVVNNMLGLEFNISHSAQKGLFGFQIHHPLGVDVEYVDTTINIDQIAPNFFSPNEVKKLQSVPLSDKLTCFYNCWTRKEAFIKAEGKGMAIPLDQFEVSLGIDERPRILAINWNPAEVKEWRLSAFSTRDSYIGAVATKGYVDDILYFEVPLMVNP